ncbi:AAA family ATPase [Microbacterium endophyticum]|nr:AAA family ATPase [Microbacterium endophyticum]
MGRKGFETDHRAVQSDSFYPFPVGQGTGERVRSVLTDGDERTVPSEGNGPGTGTQRRAALPFTNTSRPSAHSTSSPLSQASGASVPLSAIPAQPGSSWLPTNLAECVSGLQSGTLTPPRPSVGRLTDGSYWLYAGATNGLAGESGCGKTWTALAAAAAELEDSNNVIYIDMEDGPIGLTARMLALGVPPGVLADPVRFAYVRPEEAFRDDVRSIFWALLDQMRPSLVVLDSTGESMALEGTDPNSDDAVALWFQRVATAIATRGPAVLLLDHLPKSDSAAPSPIGSQRKRAAISGAQFIQTIGKEMAFAKGRPGQARLTATKDRHGNFVTGEVSMTLTVNPAPSRGTSSVDALLGPIQDDEWAPTRHMLGISEFLEANQSPQTTAAIKKGVKGKSETVLAALQVLVASGYVTTSSGGRNATLHELVKAFSIGDAYSVPDGVSEGGAPAGGCGHPWHDAKCNPDWCHATHRGRCNKRTEDGYVLDDDGEIVSYPPEMVRQREEQLRRIAEREES